MNCKKVLSCLRAYFDGEAGAKLIREMEEHIGSCSACRRAVERMRETEDLLDGLAVLPPPGEFAARVMAEARRRALVEGGKKTFIPRGPAWRPFRWLLDLSVPMRLAACSMILLACLAGMFMSREVSLSGDRPNSVAEAENLDGFEWFNPAPPASLGSAYLALASTAPRDSGTK